MDNKFANLPLDKRMELLTGKDFWTTSSLGGTVPSLTVSDGPNGLRKCVGDTQVKSTSFPSLACLGNSWSKELTYLEGRNIASICIENSVDLILGPGANIKRSPFGGRNFEYFSEDPLLSGELAKSYIEGVQSLGVGTCLKHFCCNNYEYGREFRSSEVDERTLFEIYLKPFSIALEASPWSIMPSYNCVNGIYACENKYLLTDILRDKFKYTGCLISDWGAVHNSAKSLKSGLDLRMPFDNRALNELKDAYDKKFINEGDINRAVSNISILIDKATNNKKSAAYSKEESHANAVNIAKEGIVLLKNDGVLPLDKNKKILITGDAAIDPPYGGGGSSFVSSDYKSKSLEELLKQEGYDATYRFGYNSFFTFENSVIFQRAFENDLAIVTVAVDKGKFEEGHDRETIKLSKPLEKAILGVASRIKTIVVIYCGGVIDVSSWKDCVNGIILAGYGGEGINEALSSVLTGETNPSGRLSESFITCEDNEYVDGIDSTDSYVRYTEGVFVGYRNMGNPNYRIIYPFGYGLSYSKFEYSNLAVKKINELEYEASIDVSNVSNIDGKEVVQLYVSDLSSSVSRPLRELRAFEKVYIKANSTKRVTFRLDKDAFAFYSIPLHDFYVENGLFEIQVGSSSMDIKAIERIDIELDTYSQYSRER